MILSDVDNNLGLPTMFTWDGRTTPLYIIKYGRRSFDPKAYDSCHIARPQSIASSVIERQADFFHGRLAARLALEPLGLGQYEVGIGPFREPVWPPGVMGSISHNHTYAAAVALNESTNGRIGVGIDLESVVTEEDQEMLQESTLSSRELDVLRRLPARLPLTTLVSLVFSAKESFFKASFKTVGHYFDFDAIELKQIDEGTRSIGFVVKVALARQLPAGALVTVHFMLVDDATVFTSCNLAVSQAIFD